MPKIAGLLAPPGPCVRTLSPASRQRIAGTFCDSVTPVGIAYRISGRSNLGQNRFTSGARYPTFLLTLPRRPDKR